ncbi:hypothetical protein CBM2633_A70299 [Cupriavidus taiwanensis]|nr:hypothetical protein CBM2633_A70299 [Cupriavidus taiwanensis]
MDSQTWKVHLAKSPPRKAGFLLSVCRQQMGD